MSTTTFEISPYMSTYLVAFAVSKFTCTVGEPITNNITHSVCSNPDTHMDRQLANKNSAELMQSLENFTNILYNASGLTKMDQVAIPDFSAGAMENWGLVTYREMALLYNELESSVVDKQRILTIIAHEFAHMWFGNLVTCDWWNNLFLNEGFASFFEYFTPGSISSLIADNWEMDKQFIIDQQQNVFVADGLITSNALTFDATTPSDIWGKFSSISYLKGASILRMVENFMGAENFRDGVRRYLSEREFKTASPSHLWNALQESMPEGRLPLNVSLASVMKDWIDSAGYPLVTVHARGQNIYFTQKRFLYEGSSSTEWYIPITYTISNDTSKFSGVEPNRWLIPTHIAVIPGVLQTDQWIIINNQESAYYRVNYDEELWSRIISALSTNHTLIDVLNRAQIVDDSFNLARAGELTYPQCFNIIDYLRNEREYYPWASALAGFDFLLRVLGESSTAGIRLNNLQNELIKTIRNTVSFTVNASNHIETLKSRMILGRVCRLGEEECKNSASQLFRQFRNATSVDPNLRSIVYCNGLRYGNAEDFNFLWTQLELTKVASEHVTILAALGCTKIRDRIDYYLAQSVNETSVIRRQDISRVWTSVITSNPEGINYALDYLVNNANKISEYHSGTASLITSIAARITTTEQLNKLNELGNIADLSEPLASARKTVTDNMAWASNTRQQLDLHFRSAGSIAKFLPAMIFTLIFIVILS